MKLANAVSSVQLDEPMVPYGAAEEVRISPKAATRIYKALETIMYYPPF